MHSDSIVIKINQTQIKVINVKVDLNETYRMRFALKLLKLNFDFKYINKNYKVTD